MWKKRTSFSWTACRLLVLLILLLLFLPYHSVVSFASAESKGTATVSADSDGFHSGVENSANACLDFGCPFLPRDIFYDEDAKTALKVLREQKLNNDHEEEDEEEEAKRTKRKSREGKVIQSELDTSGDRQRTTMTLCGYKGGNLRDQINQDRSILVSPFMEQFQLLGVLDGHGRNGELVSEYARTELPKEIAERLKEMAQTTNLMDLGNAEEEPTRKVSQMLKDVFQNVDKTAPEASHMGGCTASIALQLGSKLFVANAGDSVTMVGAYRKWNNTAQVVFVSREDKPHLEEEKKRIEAAGGTVQIPQSFANGDSSRVVYVDQATRMPVGLAMSRSIGDWDAPGVTAEPIVNVLDLQELYEKIIKGKDDSDCNQFSSKCGPLDVSFFVVSATDGLMDFATPETIMGQFGDAFFRLNNAQDAAKGTTMAHAHLTAEELIYSAAKDWYTAMQGQYRDDITVSATKVFLWRL